MVVQQDTTQSRIDKLSASLAKFQASTNDACRACDSLAKRAHLLDSLTSPKTAKHSMLSRANNGLAASFVLVKDAREKFETVNDCKPVIEKLHKGVQQLDEEYQRTQQTQRKRYKRVVLTEQDVYAAGDNMEILRDAYEFFLNKMHWQSAREASEGLERLHKLGVDTMCMLIAAHLKQAGPAALVKKIISKSGDSEDAVQTRNRLTEALKSRDLLKTIGDYEEFQPVEPRQIREIRAIFECLSCHGYSLALPKREEPRGLKAVFNLPPQDVTRSEPIGSGCYTNHSKTPLKSGFPQLDAYAEARRNVVLGSIDSYYRKIKQDRKKKADRLAASGAIPEHMDDNVADEANIAACDAVRCLEHAMIVIAGEKNVFRAVVTPIISRDADDEEGEILAPYLKKAGVAAYSHSVAAAVDKCLDIFETVFLKDCGIGQASRTKSGETGLTVREAARAAAAGMRMLDGVRLLGPSLAKLCEMPVANDSRKNTTIASILSVAIHRTTVKNAGRTLENLAKAIQEDPLKGPFHRPTNASVSSVTYDTIYAIRIICHFTSAYKSVSKRRALPWDPNMGERAGEMESFIRFLVMRLLNSLKGKSNDYIREFRDETSAAKSNLFMINNCFYLQKELGPDPSSYLDSEENFRIQGSWFVDKVQKVLESDKQKYLGHWEVLNTHLTVIGTDFEYSKTDTDKRILSLESGRLLKARFQGFNDSFGRTYALHKSLCVIDPSLRETMQEEVKRVFIDRYRRFHEKYSKYSFSRKKQSEYLKYPPEMIEAMLHDMYN